MGIELFALLCRKCETNRIKNHASFTKMTIDYQTLITFRVDMYLYIVVVYIFLRLNNYIYI